MKILSFLKLVEIQTKAASVIPFFAGVIYTYYRYDIFKFQSLLYFFLSMICIDMATTAINNLMDYKRAIKKHGFNYEKHNAIVKYKLTERVVIFTIFILLTLGGFFGFLLFLMTDVVVLLIGIIAFIVGIIYSYGPLPLSRTPLGELFSGVMMGGLIFFVAVYCQIIDWGIIQIGLSEFELLLRVNLYEIIVIVVVTLPFILMISNIMLANNICDLEDDIENKRYTLPYYIGRKRALNLFAVDYYLCYLGILGAIILKWLPLTALLVFLTIPIVYSNINKFKLEQLKSKTFVLSVKNFVLIGFTFVLSITLSIIIGL